MHYSRFDTSEVTGMKRRYRGPSRFMYLCAFVLVLGVMLTFLNIYQLHKMREEHSIHQASSALVEGKPEDRTGSIVWIHGKNLQTGYLQHVFNVFEQSGFTTGDQTDEWHVLWAHDYPFKELSQLMSHLKPYQKVNHFPGSGFITNKVSLVTSKMNFIPMAFKLPKDKDHFLSYSRSHPQMMWVQKNNNHRGIHIKSAAELDMKKEGSFIQQYVDKPFLIDGHKFDIGIYTILTSINPLRVYIVEDDALFRFCPEEYYPFDPNILDKYVVHDDYLPLWKIRSLHALYSEKGFNFKVTFNEYLKSKGLPYKKVWADMIAAIQAVYLSKEHNLMETASKYPSTNNFFEMVRFDFVLDEKLNVYLMEANMSPNLSSKHFPPNKRLYEHVIFTLLSLVGLTQHLSREHLDFEEDMRVAATDIRVYPDMCSTSTCTESCVPAECKLCRKCVTRALEKVLKLAYLEHHRRGAARRVFPPAINETQAKLWDPSTDWPGTEELSDRNRLMYRWFIGKCRMDQTYCV
ncbi:putative tubulin polyglutamylase ttll-15 [Babylonia areolata]|uniref:putative tubulin polyglutamylase ttll-15 n=1 Tax=Babylonia areolata TaxID=304850 RepID=UPI003FCFD77B